MDLSETTPMYRIKLYQRTQWAQSFRVRSDRFTPDLRLRNETKIAELLTRWFARSLHPRGHVTGRAHVQDDYCEMHDGQRRIAASVYVYPDVPERDRAMLESCIDLPRNDIVRVPEPVEIELLARSW